MLDKLQLAELTTTMVAMGWNVGAHDTAQVAAAEVQLLKPAGSSTVSKQLLFTSPD